MAWLEPTTSQEPDSLREPGFGATIFTIMSAGSVADVIVLAPDLPDVALMAEVKSVPGRWASRASVPSCMIGVFVESRVLELRRVPDVAVLKPFDESILAAVLVKAERLRAGGLSELHFCCLDEDLRPWTKRRETKPGMKALYDAAGISFHDDLSI